MHVSLAEALEVRGGPLQEDEVWAVLSQSAESLHELFHKDPSAMGFIISPWSLLLMPSGNISFTDENVTQQDLRAFTAPEVLEGIPLASVSDIEKMHMYSLGMTLFWGADYEIPHSQPMKLGEHLNSLLLNMCDDVTLSRLSVRTVLDICSKHIRSSSCDPPFAYVRKLVRLVLGSLSQLDGLLTDRESLPERSKEIRERLRGKGLPTGRSAASRVLERYRVRTQEQGLNRGMSRSMGSLPILDPQDQDDPYPPSDYPSHRPGSESTTDLYSRGGPLLHHQHSQPQLLAFQPQLRSRPVELDQRSLQYSGLPRKTWASLVDLACIDPDALRFGALEDARRGSCALSTQSVGRRRAASRPALADAESRYSEFGDSGGALRSRKPQHHRSAQSMGMAGAYDRIKEKQRKLQVLRQAMDDPLHTHQRYHSDYSSSSESPSVTSSDPEYRQVRRPEEGARRCSSQAGLGPEHDALSLASLNAYRHRPYEGPGSDEGLAGAELLLRSQEEEVQRLQAHLALRLSRANLYTPDELSTASRGSVADLQGEPFNMPTRKAKSFYGPEFVKMTCEPCVSLTVPSSIMKRGKVEEVQRKVGVVLLNRQRLELSCDIKAVCKDVLDMVVAHVGLVEHHLFALAYLRENEFFFVEPDAKLSKVAPEGWKDEPRKKRSDVPFNLFLRIKFFMEDISYIQHDMTKHQYYLQLRKDILEERVRCDTENAMLLASLALQAEFSDYQPELHGKTYFRLEHYLPVSVLDKLEASALKEKLPRLHNNYYGVPESEAQFEFLKVSQRLTEYGVHFHRVLPEKRSQTGIMLGVSSREMRIFEVLNGNRTPVLRFPWRDSKKISFVKKKICLQNQSDGIKHLFQTDSSKTCQYLLQLCSDQHKFHLQMKARRNNKELQELEDSPLAGRQYSLDGVGEPGRAVSPVSLTPSSTHSDSVLFKRMSYSDAALNKALSGQLSGPGAQDEPPLFPGFVPGGTVSANPRLMSRSHHNLGQVPESPEHRAAAAAATAMGLAGGDPAAGSFESSVPHGGKNPPPYRPYPQPRRSGSDADSVSFPGSRPQDAKAFSPAAGSSSPLWGAGRFQKGSDASSIEDAGGQSYAGGVRTHTSSEQSSTPASLAVHSKKINAVPSTEREIKIVHLKKDVKYGLGFQVAGGESPGRMDLGTIVSAITPGGPADLNGVLKPGDRLLSVNSVSLEALTHAAAADVLQSAPDDVMLLVSQPREILYQGVYQATPSVKAPPSIQRTELDLYSSEDEELVDAESPVPHRRGNNASTPTPPPASSSPLRHNASLGSQGSSGSAKKPLTPNGILQRLEKMAEAAANVSVGQSHQNPPPPGPAPGEVLPPALPPKTRKAKVPETPKAPEHSDWGDSDMDEDTCSSGPEKRRPGKDASASAAELLSGKGPGVNSLQPGDLFDVELSKQDSGLGISVTGGVNTTVRHGGIYIKAIIPNGAAELDGRIHKGDRVVAVNGKSLEGATHAQAVEALRDTKKSVHLLLEKGQPPADSVHAPLTPRCTPPAPPSDPVQAKVKPPYSFVTDDNVFDVCLLKNTSGLGFSFSREERAPGEPPGDAPRASSMVRVKKLFPGQPAAESGRVDVGDVILRVNKTSLKGLSQHEVISALRGAGQEVVLHLCRPAPGVLPDMDTSVTTPKPSPRRDFTVPKPEPSPRLARAPSPIQGPPAGGLGPVQEALERLLRKTPPRRNSYSDSTEEGVDEEEQEEEEEEEEKAFSPSSPEHTQQGGWDHSIYKTPSGTLDKGRFERPGPLDDSTHSSFYSPNLSMEGAGLSSRRAPSPFSAELDSPPQHMLSSPTSPSPDPLPPPLPLPLNLTVPGNGQDLDELVPEVELRVSLVKSEKGSLGFTLTQGNDQGCYIHDIVQDPARGDGRLRPGDRMITVNNTDVSSMGHTEVVNLVRTAPAVVDLLVGRVLEPPRGPVEAHLLPDICFSGDTETLGLVLDGGSDSPYGVLFVKDVLPGSLALSEGSLRPLDLVHYINGAPTQELTLGESRRLLQLAPGNLTLKATRDGKAVSPGKSVSFLNNNVSPNVSNSMNGFLQGSDHSEEDCLSTLCPIEEDIIKLQLEKPPQGGLGFSVIGGERGIFVKSVTPGGEAEASGKLQVGDRLLRVNDELMTGVSHGKAVTTIRRAKGLVQLVVSRPPEHNPSPYLSYLPLSSDKCNGNTDVSEDSGVKTKMGTPRDGLPSLPPIDYEVGGARDRRGSEQTTELSEDTDCDGSSLPEDSPEGSRKVDWKEESVDDLMNENYLQMSAGQPEEDAITWGSDELPIEDMRKPDDGPIISEEELTSLPLVKVVPDGQYTGPKLNSVVRMMRGLLEQKVPLQEFENLQNLQPLDDCLIGQTQENKKKNRYKNIVPFDTTRVTLGQDGGYINANFVTMAVKDESYAFIACQGPLPTTLGDFWQMVWEQKSNVIAMMTQEVEGGKVKCQRYWPDTPGTSEMVDQRLQITLVKDQYLDNFVIRFIEVKDVQSNEIQRVTHLNYTGWPDHGTPSQPSQLLTFISYMRHIHQSGPIITHCSAGIGRSGTLICIDVVLGLISKDTDFDISDVVRNMRLQRQGMVQTEEQYIFCYQVILYVLRCLQAEEKLSG